MTDSNDAVASPFQLVIGVGVMLLALGLAGVLMLTQGAGFRASTAGLVAIGTACLTWTTGSLLSQRRLPLAPGVMGFASEMITLKDGNSQMGFITLEGASEVKLRNIASQEFTFKTADIKERQKLPMSMMPPGLMMNFTVKEFASLLDYLESLVKK